jgi:hypothetical protein
MAKKPGKRSAASLSVIVPFITRPRIPAPSSLNAAERGLFNDSIHNNPHLKLQDAPFLAAYCQTVIKVNKLARKTDAASAKVWEMSARVMISMAVKLRLTSHSQTHPETAGRARNNHQPVSYYDQIRNESDD